MRLINAKTRLFENFNDEAKLPRYAILSHRWVDGQEIMYKDFLKGRNLKLSGRKKINRCCLQALADGILYVWIDTCCIDKKSSAELSEAINSMYRWYGASTVCYAYMNDVIHDNNWEQSFVKSTWFTRSWTLQEMLAPKSLKFFDAEWQFIGEKSALSEELAEASGIHLSVFTSERLDLKDWSVAQRMSWASKREATRIEDIAYSLLGIFDVNMPLLYGEGKKAFRRLQEEIIRGSHDHTLFAWSTYHNESWGVLACSPAAFEKDAHVCLHEFRRPKAYTLTKLGLSVELPIETWLPQVYWAGLNATENGVDQIGIWLLAQNVERSVYQKVVIPSEILDSREAEDGRSGCIGSRNLALLSCRYTQLTIQLNGNAISKIPQLGAAVIPSAGLEPTFASFQLKSLKVLDSEFVYRHAVRVYTIRRYRHRHLKRNIRFIDNVIFKYYRRRGIERGNTHLFGLSHASRISPNMGILHDIIFDNRDSDFDNRDCCFAMLSVGLDQQMRPIFLLAETLHVQQIEVYNWTGDLGDIQTDKLMDRTLFGKNIWQCHGLEEEGWQSPSPNPLVTLPGMQKGLWAFKATEEPLSSFSINLHSLPDRNIQIVVGKNKKDRMDYSISIHERLRQSSDLI